MAPSALLKTSMAQLKTMFFRNTSLVGFRVDLPSYGNFARRQLQCCPSRTSFKRHCSKPPSSGSRQAISMTHNPVRRSRIRVCWPQQCLLPPLSSDRSRARHDRPGTWDRSIEHRLKRLFFVRMTLLHPITGGPDRDSWSSAPRQWLSPSLSAMLEIVNAPATAVACHRQRRRRSANCWIAIQDKLP